MTSRRTIGPLHVTRPGGDAPRPFDGIHAPAWMDSSALCSQVDASMFHADPGEHGKVRQANELCRSCPLVVACFTYAMETDQRFGVWGATSPEDRNALRRKRRVA